MPLTRRQMLTTLGLGTLAVAAAPRLASGQTPAPPAPAAKEPFTLPPLPYPCLLYTSPSPRDRTRSRMPSSA